MKSVVIYLGGNGPANFPASIDKSTIVKIIAADSGLDLARKHKINVDIVIGDLDSVSQEALEEAEKYGAQIFSFDRDKDKTDFELALDKAKEFDAKQLIIVGGSGQRSDHYLANMSVLSGEQTKDYLVEAYFENEILKVCKPNQELKLNVRKGGTISLLPFNGNAHGVNTTGLKWNLADQTLNTNNALGISNIFTSEIATIKITEGLLLVLLQTNFD